MILAGKTCASVDELLRGWFNFTATRYHILQHDTPLDVRERFSEGRREKALAFQGLLTSLCELVTTKP